MELATPLSFNRFLGRQYGDFMSLAHSPNRIPNVYLCGQNVAAASAVLGGDAMADLAGDE
jgi:all-trans-retinol 13,14-reductase